MTTKRGGRQKIYENRIVENISLPEKTWKKCNEIRGQKPMTQFLGEIVCEKIGVGGIKAQKY